METETLIGALSRSATPVDRNGNMRSFALVVLGAFAWCVFAVLVMAGLRPNADASLGWIVLKSGLSLLFVLTGIPLALRLVQPGRRAGLTGWIGLAGFCAAGIAASALVMAATPETRIAETTGGRFPLILLIIPAMAIPAGAVLFLWMRSQAPTQLLQAGASGGMLAGGLAAVAYALHCPVDAPTFVLLWYPLSIAICAGLGALAGRLALRW